MVRLGEAKMVDGMSRKWFYWKIANIVIVIVWAAFLCYYLLGCHIFWLVVIKADVMSGKILNWNASIRNFYFLDGCLDDSVHLVLLEVASLCIGAFQASMELTLSLGNCSILLFYMFLREHSSIDILVWQWCLWITSILALSPHGVWRTGIQPYKRSRWP